MRLAEEEGGGLQTIYYLTRVDATHRKLMMNFHHNQIAGEFIDRGWDFRVVTTSFQRGQVEDIVTLKNGVTTVFLGRTTPELAGHDFWRRACRFLSREPSRGATFFVGSSWAGIGIEKTLFNSGGLHFLHNSWSTMQPPFEKESLLTARNAVARGLRLGNWIRQTRRLVSRGETLVVPSEFTREALLRDAATYQIPLKPTKVEVIRNGVPSPRVTRTVADSRVKAGPKIQYIGRISKQKGIDLAIYMAGYLKSQGFSFQLRINGPVEDPEYLDFLRAEITRLRLSEEVKIGPGLSGPQVLEAWGEADFGIFPTKVDEGLSFSLLEALGSGVVPISTRSGGNSEVLVGELSQLLVAKNDFREMAEKVVDLWEKNKKRQHLSELSQLHVTKNFSVRQHVEKLESLLLNGASQSIA